MDFSLTRFQKSILKAAKEFAKGEFDKDIAADMDKKGKFPENIWKKAAGLGLAGVHMNGEAQGSSLAMTDQVLTAGALCAADSGLGTSVAGACRGAECLYLAGNEAINANFLYPMLDGEKLCACAFSEKSGCLNFSDISATAVDQGKFLILNGKKEYVLFAEPADFFIVLCRVPSDQAPKAETSLLIVEKKTHGIHISPLGEKLGLRMSPVADVEFSNVPVPVSNLVTDPGTGLDIVQKFLIIDQVSRAAMAAGIARGAMDRSLDYTKQRKQFNTFIADFEVTQHKFADMAVQIRSAELLIFEAAWLIDQGRFEKDIAAMALTAASMAAVNVADEAVQLMGGYGYMSEYEVERFYRDAKAIRITHPCGRGLKNSLAKEVIKRKNQWKF
ncbi:MAG: hypothetical protein A2277_06510 [Desulfobacterales bacterium RIFOXYA12_FULL_46_15]|nr:MAG: hypothetical protein A2277_06510 [Desulfobacterales bacterium RIFOXYA12_FULL_46_15]